MRTSLLPGIQVSMSLSPFLPGTVPCLGKRKPKWGVRTPQPEVQNGNGTWMLLAALGSCRIEGCHVAAGGQKR